MAVFADRPTCDCGRPDLVGVQLCLSLRGGLERIVAGVLHFDYRPGPDRVRRGAARLHILVNRFEFGGTQFTVRTLLGVKKTYALPDYKWVPALHKTINFPEKAANISFYVQNAKTGKNIRNYSWDGFPKDAFETVSSLYGYRAQTDFKQSDFGRA